MDEEPSYELKLGPTRKKEPSQLERSQLFFKLEDSYAARHMKIRPPLHVCLNNSVARPLREICKGVSFHVFSSISI